MRCISAVICPSQRWRISGAHETGPASSPRNIEKAAALGVVEFVAAVGDAGEEQVILRLEGGQRALVQSSHPSLPTRLSTTAILLPLFR